jgi:diguanylate cyclase (GGDEF)-like protein/PAS domain S-box-containing protein
VVGALRRGRTLPLESWERRHAWMVRAVWAHAVFLLAWSSIAYPAWHVIMLVFPIGVAAFVAGPPVLTRRARAAAVCFGLLLSSATIVHLMNGAVEGHFHFFVIVTLLALYEDWFTYLLALAFVLLHHGVMGVSVPGTVFNHPSAIEHPWRWAGVHALFVAALSVVNVVSWRLNENARARTVESEERFRSAFEAAPTGMALVERDGTIQRVNAAFASVVGVPGTELARRPLRDLVDADDLAGEHFPAAGAASEARLGRRDGREGWGLWHHSALHDGAGTHVGWISHCIDISERKRAEASSPGRRTTTRALTGLANRERFLGELNGAIERRRSRPDGLRVAVLFVDVDDFKVVNDSLGHDAGDRLLAAVADRLRSAVRPGDVIARFGGDEFTVLLPGVADGREARAVAERLAAALAEPLLVDGERRYVSASVGLTLGNPDEVRGATALLRDADAAMYRAKERGKARCEVFDGSMRDEALERLELETALRVALERNELQLVYSRSSASPTSASSPPRRSGAGTTPSTA